MKLGLSGSWESCRLTQPEEVWIQKQQPHPMSLPFCSVTSAVNTLWKLDLQICKPLFTWGRRVWVSLPPKLDFSLPVRSWWVRPAEQGLRSWERELGQRQRGQHYNHTLFEDLQMRVYSRHSSMCDGLLRCGLCPKKPQELFKVLTIRLHSKHRHRSSGRTRRVMGRQWAPHTLGKMLVWDKHVTLAVNLGRHWGRPVP